MYHYAGNNPVHYIDPDGRQTATITSDPSFWSGLCITLGTLAEDIATFGAGIADDPVTLGIGIGLILGSLGITVYENNKTEAKTKTASETENDSLVTLYRAVSPAEDASIQMTGTFLNIKGIESKYFSLTKKGGVIKI